MFFERQITFCSMFEKNSEMLEIFEKLCFSFSSMVLNVTQKVWNCSYEHIKTQFWHACRKTLAKSHKLVARCPKGLKDFHKRSKNFSRVSKIGKKVSFSEKIPFLSRYSFGHAECNFDISAEKLLTGGSTIFCSLSENNSKILEFQNVLNFANRHLQCISDIAAEKPLTGGWIFFSHFTKISKIFESFVPFVSQSFWKLLRRFQTV